MRVEIHSNTNQALIEILENVYHVGYEKASNQSPIAWFSLPRDDAKWSSIAAFREVWIYDDLGTLVDVFRILPFQEIHDDTTQEARVKLEGFATALQDDLVSAEVTWTNQTVTQILTDILAYQTTARVALGTIDAALNVIIAGYRVAFDNVMKACWELRNVTGGYISVDPVAGNPAARQLNLRAAPGQDIGQRVWKGWNLRSLGKTTDPTEAVTKLWPLGRGEGQNQQRPSSDILLAQPATFALGVAAPSTLVISDAYSRYKGWTAPGAPLPTGASATDTRSRPLRPKGTVAPPGAPVVAAGAAGLPNGTYRCVVTLLNGSLETNAGTEVVVTVANQQINWSSIPVGPPAPWTTGRRLYRTVAGGAPGTERLVATINDTTTTAFTDNVSDATISTAPPVPTVNTDVMDDTPNWVQGVDERTLRSTTNGYNPTGLLSWALDYVHADYLVADDTVGTYGTIARPYPDKRFESSLDLVRAARQALAVVKQPRVNYEVKVADLARTYPTETIERLALHDQINVVDDLLGTAAKLRIVRVHYEDLWDPNSFSIVVGTIDSMPADVRLQDRARAYAQMADGATNIWVDSFEDNLDPTHPYTRSIYIPPDAVAVNALTLNLKTKAYRYYVKAVSTTADAAHSHVLPWANYLNGQTSFSGTGASGGPSNAMADHSHADPQGGVTAGANPIISNTYNPHTHTGPSHAHGPSVGQYWLIDTQTAVNGAHQHAITLVVGINETTTPATMELKVDGAVASASATTLTDFDLTPYLTKDAAGKIVRGWHDLTFTPDVNGRIQAAIYEKVFIQSRGVVAG